MTDLYTIIILAVFVLILFPGVIIAFGEGFWAAYKKWLKDNW